MVDYYHLAAVAKARHRPRGRLSIDFHGPMSLFAIGRLERQVLPERMVSSCTIERIDTALTMFAGPVQHDSINFPAGMPPSAVIVRPDQYVRSIEFCELLAKCGIVRSVWLLEEIAIADLWLDQYACKVPLPE